MAFENVDVSSLKSAISSCKNSIHCETSEELISKISNNSVWNTESRKNLKKSLEKLTNVRYKELRTKLNVAEQVAGKIEIYQNLKKENEEMTNRIHNDLEPRLWRIEAWVTYDEEGNPQHHSDRVMDQGIKREIDEIDAKIEKNKREMEHIENEVSGIVGGM